jgi:glycosyltransferase involved in cell wall biosynthesis
VSSVPQSRAVATARDAVSERVRAVMKVLFADRSDIDNTDLGTNIARLVSRLHATLDPAEIWLALTALAAALPSEADILSAQRKLAEVSAAEALPAFLGAAFPLAWSKGDLSRKLRIVSNSVVVDVDFCAKNDHNTGIQRVVRKTMPFWARGHAITLLAWNADRSGYRMLSQLEQDRVLRWGERDQWAPHGADSAAELIVPWNSLLVLAEVPAINAIEALAATAKYSGNRVSVIGYDTIPVVSSDFVDEHESNRFAQYLSVVKHAHRLAAISHSAADEFVGFAQSIESQGIAGPEILAIPLGVDVKKVLEVGRPLPVTPKVLMVGSLEPRKNQLGVMFACELLWRQGLDFEFRMIGGGSARFVRELESRVAALRRAGRRITLSQRVSDAELWEAYSEASFLAFPSLHEGYGLPVAEALAMGLPVITSDFGSTRELAEDGGCILVDPRSDRELTLRLEEMIQSPELIRKLRTEIANRRLRDWSEYATELWSFLVEDEQELSSA